MIQMKDINSKFYILNAWRYLLMKLVLKKKEKENVRKYQINEKQNSQ